MTWMPAGFLGYGYLSTIIVLILRAASPSCTAHVGWLVTYNEFLRYLAIILTHA